MVSMGFSDVRFKKALINLKPPTPDKDREIEEKSKPKAVLDYFILIRQTLVL